MNYLAHLYLSKESEEIMVGNFIGDYVKGKKYLDYPDSIAKGIILHRQIDSFTDNHRNTKNAKELFRSEFGLYSGIIVDFLYDHFLAKNWSSYSNVTLRTFAKKVHAILLSNFRILPGRVQGFLPFLIQNKRLESYASIDGIINSMRIMANYSSLPSKSEKVRIILDSNYNWLETNFNEFMREVIVFVEKKFEMEYKN